MRKYIFLMLSLLLVLGLAAQAESTGTQDLKGKGTENTPSGGILVTLKLEESYKFTIPGVGGEEKAITLTGGGARENVGSLGVSEVILLPGESLKVSVDSKNHYQVLNEYGDSLEYSVEFYSLRSGTQMLTTKSPDGPIEIFTYTPAASGIGEESRTVFMSLGQAAHPGTYTDTLTFTAKIVTQADSGEP